MKKIFLSAKGVLLGTLFMTMAMCCSAVSGCSKSAAGGLADNKDHKDSSKVLPGTGLSSSIAYMPDKKGTKLTYSVVSGEEVGTTSQVEFADVHDSLSYTVGTLEAVTAGIKSYGSVRHDKAYTYDVSYLAPIYYQFLATMAATMNTFTHQETPLTMKLPHKDPLHKQVFSTVVTASWHGVKIEDETKTDNKLIQTAFEGIIDSTGTITTNAGTFKDCIRVHYLRNQQRVITITSPDDNSTVDNTGHFDERIWMAKGVGPVRTLELNMDTGITTVTDLTKIELP